MGIKINMNINSSKKKFAAGMIVLFIGLACTPSITHAVAGSNSSQYVSAIIEFTQEFSKPVVGEDGQYLKAAIEESYSFIMDPSRPMMPDFTKTFEFPRGTKITGIEVTPSEIQTMSISKKIKPAPTLQSIGDKIVPVDGILDKETYSSSDPYPSKWYYFTKGAGINKDGDHVLYLSIHMHQTRYIPAKNILQYVEQMNICISYEEPIKTTSPLVTTYDLLIITPSEFSDDLQPLIEHKNSHGIETQLVTLDFIYDIVPGRDQAEQIKYFIYYALNLWNIKYVLLVGDITKLPIRSTDAYPWGDDFGGNILSDLYYADIYDENYSFCSWDYNDNDIFGETEYSGGFPPEMKNYDAVDLYPDVGIGRLPCTNSEEVRIVVNKIITYEEYTYDQLWFKKIILAGGDTFPPSKRAPFFIYEGEITNTKVAQQLPDFEPIMLWSSKRNLNAITFNRAINKGAGFLSYAGHGFEHGWGTYRPNALQSRMGFTQPLYYTPFIKFLRNQNKLPIIFFDACLTAKLDFNISDLDRYYPLMTKFLHVFTRMQYDISDYYPCFAWSFLAKESGGAIATIGATRPAYTYVDKDGVYAGAGYLDVHFFKAYEEGVTVSQMLTQAQNDYINNVGKDYFTIEEYMLIGDPSLMVGGYP